MTPELTVLVLTLNEAGSLGPFIERLRPVAERLAPGYELLVVDGGSTDGTPELARAGGARVSPQRGPGYGSAYRQGLEEAAGRFVLTMDPDAAHPVSAIEALWRERERYDVVMGSRYIAGAADTRPPFRRLLSVLLNQAYRRLLGLPYTDVSGGFRLYRASTLRGIRTEGRHYDVVAETLARLAFAGARILEVPYRYAPREAGASKARILRFGFCYLWTLLKLRRERAAA